MDPLLLLLVVVVSVFVGALVLFAITTELGRRAQVGYSADAPPNYASSATLMHWLRTIAILAILFLMIYKPGA